jgi:hypothetical protein
MPSAAGETRLTTLAALIVERRRAVAGNLEATREADLALFAWQGANPARAGASARSSRRRSPRSKP